MAPHLPRFFFFVLPPTHCHLPQHFPIPLKPRIPHFSRTPTTMESLRAMFPDVDPATLQATLTAHNNSVERTVDYLLSNRHAPPSNNPPPTSTLERQRQEEEDAALARRLQAEQDLAYHEAAAPTARSQSQHHPFGLPTLGDVQNAVKPIVDGVQYAGRAAVEGINSLYREYVVGGDQRGGGRRREEREDDTVVLRGEASSPGGAQSTRMRRGFSGGGASTVGGKKDA